MITVFKLNDRVFHIQHNWGTVKNVVRINSDYPIEVEFDSGCLEFFTIDGKYYEYDLHPSLSFTEYNFVTGGFSQVRPLPNIEVDTLIYVRGNEHHSWEMRYFSHFDGNRLFAYDSQKTSKTAFASETTYWRDYSLENPLEL